MDIHEGLSTRVECGVESLRTAFTAQVPSWARPERSATMIRKLPDGQYRLYSRKPDPKTGKRRNLGTFPSREAAEKHEREVQYFKRAH
jgi:hypothetical protein